MKVLEVLMRNCQTALNFQQEWLRLEGLGVPLEPLEYRLVCGPGGGLLIAQEGDIATNIITELKHGIVACVLDLRIVSNEPGKIFIMDYALELPWAVNEVQWLPSLQSRPNQASCYEYFDSQLIYPGDVVLNDRMEARSPLQHGDMISGLLLGVSYERVPPKYRHGSDIVVPLVLYDQFHRAHSDRVHLWLDRSISLDRRKQPQSPSRIQGDDRNITLEVEDVEEVCTG